MRPDIQGEDIKKYFYILEDETPLDTYGHFYELSENLKLTMNLKNYSIDQKAKDIRQKRDAFLKHLDLPFMIALEDEDPAVRNHIKNMKEFLRDLPNNLRFDDLKEAEDVILYNPFGNIFDIQVVFQGSGYVQPPSVEIDSPRGTEKGFAAEAIAFIKDGRVTRVEVIESGCAYDYVPLVKIDPPEEGDPAIVMCAPPQNITITEEDLLENTTKYYS